MYLVAWHQDKSVLVFITFKLIKFFVVALRSYFCSRFSNQIAEKVESVAWNFIQLCNYDGDLNFTFGNIKKANAKCIFWFDHINCFHFLLNDEFS